VDSCFSEGENACIPGSYAEIVKLFVGFCCIFASVLCFIQVIVLGMHDSAADFGPNRVAFQEKKEGAAQWYAGGGAVLFMGGIFLCIFGWEKNKPPIQ